ncbi:MAG TPA: iron-containing alcohol dehydrogenase [bacterium]|nr:iron-containing alcohol dehydrogenase [bacterium]HOL48772.1 iron-containing alcohol dehydrogenase [bacterium]HPQ19878.1 iron-containing alcohol dehydrogenase [bacterium]
MNNNFIFSRTPHIIFGQKKINELTNQIKKFGKNILFFTGATSLKKSGILDKLLNIFNDEEINYTHITINKEPSPDLIDEIVKENKNKKINVIVSIGGGSVIDAGKAVSAMLLQNDSVYNYLEQIGNKNHNGKKIPFIAIPTTAGTGSEATKNSVLSKVGEYGFKKSIRHDNFIPDIAIIDGELFINCPSEIAAVCGMDAFSQLLESYISTKSFFFTAVLCLPAMKNIILNIEKICSSSASIEEWEKMALAALTSGITLANAGLCVIHGFAASIGGLYEIPHGVICGSLLPPSVELIIKKIIKTDKNNFAIKKFIDIAKLFNSQENKSNEYYLDSLINNLYQLTNKLKIPALTKYNLKANDFKKIAEITEIKNNPIKLSQEELYEILLLNSEKINNN